MQVKLRRVSELCSSLEVQLALANRMAQTFTSISQAVVAAMGHQPASSYQQPPKTPLAPEAKRVTLLFGLLRLQESSQRA